MDFSPVLDFDASPEPADADLDSVVDLASSVDLCLVPCPVPIDADPDSIVVLNLVPDPEPTDAVLDSEVDLTLVSDAILDFDPDLEPADADLISIEDLDITSLLRFARVGLSAAIETWKQKQRMSPAKMSRE